MDRVAEDDELLHAPLFVAESAQLERLASSGETSDEILSLLEWQLAERFQLVQKLVLGTCGAYFGLAVAIGHVFPSARTLFFVAFLSFVWLVVVISFPTDLTCPAARQLMQPLTSAFAVGLVVNMSHGFFFKLPDVNEACTLINAVIYIVSCAITLLNAYSACAGTLTWRRLHALFLADGLTFGAAVLALRYYAGAPIYANVYPPCGHGCVTFHPALLRAISPLAMSLAFPRGVRTRAAAAANRLGWNHVAISLDEMLRRRSSRSASLRRQAADSSSSRDASEEDIMSSSASYTSVGGSLSLSEMERQHAAGRGEVR